MGHFLLRKKQSNKCVVNRRTVLTNGCEARDVGLVYALRVNPNTASVMMTGPVFNFPISHLHQATNLSSG